MRHTHEKLSYIISAPYEKNSIEEHLVQYKFSKFVLYVVYEAHMEFQKILYGTHMKFLHYVNAFSIYILDMDFQNVQC